MARTHKACIIFIDEVDAIVSIFQYGNEFPVVFIRLNGLDLPYIGRSSFRWWCWRRQRSTANNVGTDHSTGWIRCKRKHQGIDGYQQAWHLGPCSFAARKVGSKGRVLIAGFGRKTAYLEDSCKKVSRVSCRAVVGVAARSMLTDFALNPLPIVWAVRKIFDSVW